MLKISDEISAQFDLAMRVLSVSRAWQFGKIWWLGMDDNYYPEKSKKYCNFTSKHVSLPRTTLGNELADSSEPKWTIHCVVIAHRTISKPFPNLVQKNRIEMVQRLVQQKTSKLLAPNCCLVQWLTVARLVDGLLRHGGLVERNVHGGHLLPHRQRTWLFFGSCLHVWCLIYPGTQTQSLFEAAWSFRGISFMVKQTQTNVQMKKDMPHDDRMKTVKIWDNTYWCAYSFCHGLYFDGNIAHHLNLLDVAIRSLSIHNQHVLLHHLLHPF